MTTKVYAEYPTPDITLATVLKENGNKLDRIQINGMKGIFYFLDVDEQTLINYETGNLLVEPQSFHTSLKNLVNAVQRHVNASKGK